MFIGLVSGQMKSPHLIRWLPLFLVGTLTFSQTGFSDLTRSRRSLWRNPNKLVCASIWGFLRLSLALPKRARLKDRRTLPPKPPLALQAVPKGLNLAFVELGHLPHPGSIEEPTKSICAEERGGSHESGGMGRWLSAGCKMRRGIG